MILRLGYGICEQSNWAIGPLSHLAIINLLSAVMTQWFNGEMAQFRQSPPTCDNSLGAGSGWMLINSGGAVISVPQDEVRAPKLAARLSSRRSCRSNCSSFSSTVCDYCRLRTMS